MMKYFIIGFGFLFHVAISAQETQINTYSLNDCIGIALKNNFALKSTELKSEASKVNFKQSWNNTLPTLNGNYNIGISKGRSIDPFTNDYVNEQLTFSNAGINLSATVFNGFKLINTIKQNKLGLKASEMEIEEAKQDLILNVTQAYLQILYARDLVQLAKSRLEVTEKQVDRLQVLYDEEVGNPADFTDMKGQLASDSIAVINAENSFKEAVLNLLQQLGIEEVPDAEVQDVEIPLTFQKYPYNAEEVYNDALENLATFKAKELRLESAIVGVKAARGEYAPEIAIFGQLNTNYSSAAQLYTETGTALVETGDFVDVSGQQYPVMTNLTLFDSDEISYNNQFDNNLNKVIGVSVTVPLFNGFRARNNVSLQRIQSEESAIDLQNTKLLFHNAIEEAYLKMESAFNRYAVLEKQVDAFEESFRINEIRFNNGASNIVEYIISKNNLDGALLNLSNARYEYILRIKILDYYRGV